jgi:hypothetical protein
MSKEHTMSKYHYDAAGNFTHRTCVKCGREVFYNLEHQCKPTPVVTKLTPENNRYVRKPRP